MFAQEILTFDPQQVDASFLHQYGIISLIQEGYGFHGTDREIEKWVLEEFTQNLENPVVHCVLHPQDSQRVGTLIILGRPTYPSVEGTRFSAFWTNVLTVDPELGQHTDGQLRALEIGGIFISKDNPSRGPGGDADKLLDAIISLYNPHAIVGVTCSPSAIRWRLRVVQKHGLLTLIGDQHEGVGWNAVLRDIADSLAQGYIPLHGTKGPQGAVIVERDYLEPQREIKIPSQVDTAFRVAQALWLQQQMLSADKTAATTVISINPQYHLQTPEEQFF